MKKFILFLGLCLLFAGIRLSDNGLLSVNADGKFTVYGAGGVETTYEQKPLLDRFSGYTRLDICGDRETAYECLLSLGATLLWEETVDEIVVIYAYSPFIRKYETVKGQRVNIMAAVSDKTVALGCPLLKGSY